MHNNKAQLYNLWDPLRRNKACAFNNRQSRRRQLIYKFNLNCGRHNFLQSKHNSISKQYAVVPMQTSPGAKVAIWNSTAITLVLTCGDKITHWVCMWHFSVQCTVYF